MSDQDWKYELVIQFDDEQGDAIDRVIAFEDELIELLDGVAEVEGHDVDKGVANIFILTNAPAKLWERLEPLVEDSDANELDALAAAYRKVDGETFTVLWPTDYEGEIEVS